MCEGEEELDIESLRCDELEGHFGQKLPQNFRGAHSPKPAQKSRGCACLPEAGRLAGWRLSGTTYAKPLQVNSNLWGL